MSPAAAPRRYYAACRGSDPPQGPARPVSVELGHDEQQRTLLVDAGGTRPCRTGGARGLSPGLDLRGRNALAVPQGRHLARLWRAESGQIGRASCRERECQYVYISVVGGSLKKNNIM